MFDIDIQIDDINICSIESQDVAAVQKWINYQRSFCIGTDEPIDKKEFYNRFLEYYVSECEFFLKIEREQKLIGVLKGRIEFRNPNEVWFSYFLIENNLRSQGLGSNIFNGVCEYFSASYGILDFFIGVAKNDKRAIRFWTKNNFELQRVSKSFFSINGNSTDMLILKRAK